MVVKAAPAAPFIMAEADLLLELLIGPDPTFVSPDAK
jgi:hypothetical protein